MTMQDGIILKLIEFEKGQPKRVQHFLKVFVYAHLIGEAEGLAPRQQLLTEIGAIVHDIGITPSKEKYGYCDSITQGIEGPPRVRRLFAEVKHDLTEQEIERICYLIKMHHNYEQIEGIDYRILVEADFLVNAFEEKLDKESIQIVKEKIFRTNMGIKLLETM